jgi:NhaP-type Na+/H+ or K+/H+ antiporter
MLALTTIDGDIYWFVPLLFLVVRPLAVYLGLLGTGAATSRQQRALISWFGIRGIGSIYYLVFAIGEGLPRALADKILAITLATVAGSIIVHGISVTPLMRRYAHETERRRKRRTALKGGEKQKD